MLLGPDNAWAARFATGPTARIVLVSVALLLHIMDLISGVRMMQVYGIEQELNPLARALFSSTGPLGLALVKLVIVVAGVLVIAWLGRQGRVRLARNALVCCALVGLLGFTSNLI